MVRTTGDRVSEMGSVRIRVRPSPSEAKELEIRLALRQDPFSDRAYLDRATFGPSPGKTSTTRERVGIRRKLITRLRLVLGFVPELALSS